jgi:hypothetical protein
MEIEGHSLEINKTSMDQAVPNALSSATAPEHILSHTGGGNNVEPTFELDENTLRSLQQFIESQEFQSASQSSEQVQRVILFN